MISDKERKIMAYKRSYALAVLLLVILVGTACEALASQAENDMEAEYGNLISDEGVERSDASREMGALEGVVISVMEQSEGKSVSDGQGEDSASRLDQMEENLYEDPEDIEDYLWVYDDNWAIIEDYERFGEEWELPGIDDETFAVIKAAYGEIDFNGKFEIGDPEIYDEYRWKFWELLQGRGWILDSETGEEFTVADYLEYDSENNYYIYYFFDIDGDNCPELGILEETQCIYFLCYDKETDRFIVWYDGMGGFWTWPIGTRKGMCAANGKWYSYFLLDENADIECGTNFFYYPHGDDVLRMVTLPVYADKEREVEVTQKMKEQGAYVRSFEQWFFRVTEEQYNELTGPYFEAYWKGYHERNDVTYSYDELFGDFIQEETQGVEAQPSS